MFPMAIMNFEFSTGDNANIIPIETYVEYAGLGIPVGSAGNAGPKFHCRLWGKVVSWPSLVNGTS